MESVRVIHAKVHAYPLNSEILIYLSTLIFAFLLFQHILFMPYFCLAQNCPEHNTFDCHKYSCFPLDVRHMHFQLIALHTQVPGFYLLNSLYAKKRNYFFLKSSIYIGTPSNSYFNEKIFLYYPLVSI